MTFFVRTQLSLAKTCRSLMGYTLCATIKLQESAMYRSVLLCLAIAGSQLICCLFAGCANEPVVPAATVVPTQQDQTNEGAADGIGSKVTDLFEQAKSKTPSLDDMKKMLSDAGDATGQTTDDTMNWVNEMYKSLSDRGLTSAKSAGDWVAEDWNSMNAWEYKVVRVGSEQTPNALAEKLNESGKNRWDCFHVSEAANGTTFYMKRQKKSYLKNVPLKDMMKLIPLLDNDNGQ